MRLVQPRTSEVLKAATQRLRVCSFRDLAPDQIESWEG